VPSKDLAQFLPTSVQKSFFMLSRSARAVLDTALGKYRPGRTDLISVGGITRLKPALRLMTYYRLMIQEVTGTEVVISYTRWLEAVIVKGTENQEVYVTFSPQFERISLETKSAFRVIFPRTGQFQTPESIFDSFFRLGNKVRRWRIPAYFAGGTSTGVRPGVDQGSGGQCHSRSALASLAELPATGDRRRRSGALFAKVFTNEFVQL
jgi:hypothetical protein